MNRYPETQEDVKHTEKAGGTDTSLAPPVVLLRDAMGMIRSDCPAGG